VSRENSPPYPTATHFTVGFSSHRLETLEPARTAMAGHEAVVLEEPPTAAFRRALADPGALEEYLWESETAFPVFARQQLQVLRHLTGSGSQILQIEPYLQRLLEIHELLADGRTPEDVAAREDLAPVYAMERECTAAVLTFYRLTLEAPFPEVVTSVQVFARADARRFRLRDRWRAAALEQLAGRFASVYVEAGYMHQALPGELTQRLGRTGAVRSFYLLEEYIRPQLGTPRVFGPGDELTLKYLFETPLNLEAAKELAARSLIYIKLLSQKEMAPTPDSPFPHTAEEMTAARLVAPLTFPDCEKLFALLKTAAPETCRRQVRWYLKNSYGHDPISENPIPTTRTEDF